METSQIPTALTVTALENAVASAAEIGTPDPSPADARLILEQATLAGSVLEKSPGPETERAYHPNQPDGPSYVMPSGVEILIDDFTPEERAKNRQCFENLKRLNAGSGVPGCAAVLDNRRVLLADFA